MSRLIVFHDSDGNITSWQYHPDDDYTPEDGELAADGVDHRALARKQVDTSTDPPTLIDDPTYDPSPVNLDGLIEQSPIRRDEVSTDSKAAFRDARSTSDFQTQLDIVFEILTGEQP